MSRLLLYVWCSLKRHAVVSDVCISIEGAEIKLRNKDFYRCQCSRALSRVGTPGHRRDPGRARRVATVSTGVNVQGPFQEWALPDIVVILDVPSVLQCLVSIAAEVSTDAVVTLNVSQTLTRTLRCRGAGKFVCCGYFPDAVLPSSTSPTLFKQNNSEDLPFRIPGRSFQDVGCRRSHLSVKSGCARGIHFIVFVDKVLSGVYCLRWFGRFWCLCPLPLVRFPFGGVQLLKKKGHRNKNRQ